MTIQRRTVLTGTAAVAGGAVLGGPFQGFVAAPAGALGAPAFRGLRAVPDLRDGTVRLHLPAGFSYRSFHDTTTPITLDDGTKLPGRHDGMAAFAGDDGRVTLVRNHEVNGSGTAFGPIGDHTYDPKALGGCTVIDTTLTGEVEEAWTGINGTMMNCSGGPMPWGAWVTCEETVNGPDVAPDFTGASNTALTKPHGFIFEVPTTGRSDGEPVTKAGRFAHESVAFDPRGGSLYLTEDNFGFPSGFYRYTPKTSPMDAGHLANDGHLQMLKVKGVDQAHLEASQAKGTRYHVEWVDIDDPDPTFRYTPGQTAPTANDDAIVYVGDQGRAQGAAGFSRLEGAIHDNGVIYFTSTQGGGAAMEGPDTMDQGAAVEAVLGAEHGVQHALVPRLHRALDDDVERLGGAAPRQDGLARPEIADVEGGAEFFDLLLAQAVEGRVVGVEAALHGGRSMAGAGGVEQPRPRRAGSSVHVRRGRRRCRSPTARTARRRRRPPPAPAGWRRTWTPARCRRRRSSWRTAPGCRRGTAPPGSRRSAPRPPC